MYKNILVSVDLGKPGAEIKAISAAVDFAQRFSANLHVMTVVPDYGLAIVGGFFPPGHEKEAIAHANEKLHEFTKQHVPEKVKYRHIVGHGSIYREILKYAGISKADLIVLSASTPDPEDYLMGPNAARVVRHAKISVLVIR